MGFTRKSDVSSREAERLVQRRGRRERVGISKILTFSSILPDESGVKAWRRERRDSLLQVGHDKCRRVPASTLCDLGEGSPPKTDGAGAGAFP